MKKVITFIIGFFISISIYSQNGEFQTYPNGLIYSEKTMTKLGHIVDSLNLKFKTCDFDKVFYSKQQAIGHLVILDSGDMKSAQRDLDQDISFEDFCSKYPFAEIINNILITKNKYRNYSKKEIVEIEHFNLNSDYGFSIISEDIALYDKDFTNKWLFEYTRESKYSKEKIVSFFFPEDFQSTALPQKYSFMVGYADCLIDTTTSKFKQDLKEGSVELPENWNLLPDNDKAKLLDDMRSTLVVGFCSMDSRPREHAINIALLSADTYNWEVFLKAHLDIMNDRFERMSDGNYAWERRETYIKELEELNIDVIALILGISFRIENPSANHYYSSVGRVGRALAETENRHEVESAILSVIMDDALDNYNRLIFYFLFNNYNYYIEDETIQKENNEKLANALATLPDYFKNQMKPE